MNLISTLEKLKQAPLSAEETKIIKEFQSQFQIDDDDPLVVIVAIMMQSQLIIATAPDLLRQKVIETIELHKTNLREQAVLSAKEIVGDIAATLLQQQKNLIVIWRQRFIWAGIGAGTTVLIFILAITSNYFLK